MGKSVKVVFIKQRPDDNIGTVFIRTIEGKVIKKKTTRIKVTPTEWEKFFNPTTQRFRIDKRFPYFETYNSIIDKLLGNLQDVRGNLELIGNDKRSFLDYWDHCLKHTKNHGSVLKHQVVKSKLLKFLHQRKQTNLYFKEITPMFLKEFKYYLEVSNDPKRLSTNSVTHYLKIIKSILNKSITDDYYTYIKHPFTSLSFSKEKTSKNVLTEKELRTLIKKEIEDKDLREVRDLFLFQLFSNGMRVSDVLLLQWKCISSGDGRLNYTMFKTRNPLSVHINLNLCLILSRRLGLEDRYNKLYDTLTIDFTSKYQRPSPFGRNVIIKYDMKTFDNIIKNNIVTNEGKTTHQIKSVTKRSGLGVTGSSSVSITKQDNLGTVIKYKGYQIWDKDTDIRRVIDKREELLSSVNLMFLRDVLEKIGEMNNEKKREFIFPLLSESVFENFDYSSVNRISLEQYKEMKHSSIVYNRKLKKLQELCGIETKLTSHVSRHSFTNLLLKMDGVNLYDVSQSLGHSNLRTTENYIKDGFNVEKIDYLNKSISIKYSI